MSLWACGIGLRSLQSLDSKFLQYIHEALLHGYTFIPFNRVKTARKTKFLSVNNGFCRGEWDLTELYS